MTTTNPAARTSENSQRDRGEGGLLIISRAFDGLQGLIGLVFVLAGGSKLAGSDDQVEDFERYGYPQWFRIVTGGIEVSGGLGLLAGLFRPSLAVGGGGLVIGSMTGAVYTHLLRIGDPPSEAMPATILLVLTATVSQRQWQRSMTETSDTNDYNVGARHD